MAFDNGGSGVMASVDEGTKVKYSYDLLMDYKQEDQKVCKQWQPNAALTSGTYKIEIFNHGYIVGSDNFKLL